VHPTTEEIAKAIAARSRPEPVSRYEMPAPKQLATGGDLEEADLDPEDDDDAQIGDPGEDF
jgi:hypothetical protein